MDEREKKLFGTAEKAPRTERRAKPPDAGVGRGSDPGEDLFKLGKKTMVRNLTEGPLTKQLLIFIAPFMLSNLMQSLYSMVDMAVVGRFCGSAGLSAVSIGGQLLDCFTFFGIGMTGASQIIIAQHIGSGDREGVKKAIGTAFTFILALSFAVMAFGLVFADVFLEWLNTPAEAFEQARSYCVTCYFGMFFIFGYNIVSSILRGMGEANKPFVFILVATITNIVLDLVFVGVFGMGAFGAALATVMGQAVSFVVSMVYLYRRRRDFGFDFKPASFRIDMHQLGMLVRLGLPLMIQHTAISVTLMYVGSFLNDYGVVYSAVSGVGFKISRVVNIITMATNTGGSAIIGQNFGAGKIDRVKRIIGIEMIMCVSFAALLSVVLLLFPRGVFGLFSDDAQVLELAPAYAPYSVMFFFGAATRSPLMGFVNGIGNSSLAMFIGIMDGIVARISLALGLGIAAGMGVTGFWLGDSLAGFVPGIIGAVYFLSGKWKSRKLIIQ